MTPAYTAQPLGAGGRPLVIDRLSVAWLRWHGVALLSAIDMIVGMSMDTRRRPWATQTQIASIHNGIMIADLGVNDTEHQLEMVLEGIRASVGARLSDDVVMERSRLRISIGLPDAYAAGLPGRPLDTVIAMPFAFDAVIDETVRTGDSLVLSLRDPWMPLPIAGLARP